MKNKKNGEPQKYSWGTQKKKKKKKKKRRRRRKEEEEEEEEGTNMDCIWRTCSNHR